MSTDAPKDTVNNAVKAIGEVFLMPGTSQFLDGNLKSGAAHAATAMAARLVLGPIGWVAVGANSFSRSVTGKPLYGHFSKAEPSRAAAEEAVRRSSGGDIAPEDFERAVAAAAEALKAPAAKK